MRGRNFLGFRLTTPLTDDLANWTNSAGLGLQPQAEALTGIAAGDFSRIRNVKLDRFTIDRLITVLEGLDKKLRISVTVKPHSHALAHAVP